MDNIVFITPRLFLYELTDNDASNLVSVFGDPEVMRFSVSGIMNAEAIKAFIKRTKTSYEENHYGLWGVQSKDDGQFVGVCGLIKQTMGEKTDIEISYRIRRSAQNKGYATESAKAILRYAFDELKIQSIVAFIEADNSASIAVAIKAGLRYSYDDVFHSIPVKVYAIEQ